MSSLSIAKLRVTLPDGKEQLISLKDGQSITVGRELSNDLSILDAGVSRHHATFSASASGVVVADMGSTNGTFVNGQQLSSMKDLSSKDIIDIGNAKIVIELNSSEVAETESNESVSRAMTARMKPVAVTVLITSVRNYTDLIKRLPPGDVAEMLLAWKNEVTQAVEEYDGTIDKIIGNHIVSVWMGVDDKDLAVHAAHAAQRILQNVDDLIKSARWSYQDEHPWKSSIVMSSGLGLTGAWGGAQDPDQRGFTIVGDPINEAFQIESKIDSLKSLVIISESSSKLVDDIIILNPLGKITLPETKSDIQVFSF